MLFFIEEHDSINKQIDFYQIFTNNNLLYTDNSNNYIYSFEVGEQKNFINLKINLDDFKFNIIKCEIKIMDHIISYKSKINKIDCVFMSKLNFIKPSESEYNIPIFNYIYKKINSNKLPNLIKSEYDLVNLFEFKIYDLNDVNIQFVIETNLSDNTIKKYFITKNLNLLKNFI